MFNGNDLKHQCNHNKDNNMKLQILKENFDNFLREASSYLPDAHVMSIDDFLNKELGGSEMKNEAEGAATTDDGDTEAMGMIKGRAAGDKFSMKQDKPIIHKNNIVDDQGNVLDQDELKKKFAERPREMLAQNTKMKHSGGGVREFWDISLPAYMGLYYDRKSDEIKVINVCTSAGDCKLFCYARKGGYVQFPASSLRSTQIITFLKNDPEEFKNALIRELKVKQSKKKEIALRWHDSGDFIDSSYMKLAFEVAKATPEVTHYAYTKRVKMLSGAEAPDNFIIQYSFGGIEDKSIDTGNHRYSKVVPRELFKGLLQKVGDDWVYTNDQAKGELKSRVAKEYNLSPDTVITYDELMKMPYDKNTQVKNKYNVIIKGGDGDDAAARKETRGIFLLEH